MKLADNVEMLEVKIPRGDKLSVIYPTLTWDDEHLVLFDTGYPDTADYVIAAIEAAGFEAANLTDIILTHQDVDHIGGANDLLKIAPQAKLYAHQVDTPFIEGQETPTKLAGLEAKIAAGQALNEFETGFRAMLKAGFAKAHVPVEKQLTDHEVLDFCGGIETIFTPGHTPGHASFLLKASNLLICGDAANIANGQLIGSNPSMTWDMTQAEKSLQKLLDLQATGAISYHTGFLKF